MRVILGNKGLIVQIKDTGPGFDVRKVYNHYRTQKKYYSKAGNGIRLMARSPIFGVLHDSTGTVFILLYLFDNGLEALAPQQTVRAPA